MLLEMCKTLGKSPSEVLSMSDEERLFIEYAMAEGGMKRWYSQMM